MTFTSFQIDIRHNNALTGVTVKTSSCDRGSQWRDSEVLDLIASQKAIIQISLSPHPRYHRLTNDLASTAFQLINETVKAAFSGRHFHSNTI